MRYLIVIFFLFSNLTCLGQENLIQNGDFESTNPHQTKTEFKNLESWNSNIDLKENQGDFNPKLYNSKLGELIKGVCEKAPSGDQYIGIKLFERISNNRQFAIGRLISTLSMNDEFEFSVSICHKGEFQYGKLEIDTIDIVLSDQAPMLIQGKKLSFSNSQVVQSLSVAYDNKNKGWNPYKQKLIPKSGELKYITIGEFEDNPSFSETNGKFFLTNAFYFFDNLKIIKINIDDSDEPIKDPEKKTTREKSAFYIDELISQSANLTSELIPGDTILFRNIYFKTKGRARGRSDVLASGKHKMAINEIRLLNLLISKLNESSQYYTYKFTVYGNSIGGTNQSDKKESAQKRIEKFKKMCWKHAPGLMNYYAYSINNGASKRRYYNDRDTRIEISLLTEVKD